MPEEDDPLGFFDVAVEESEAPKPKPKAKKPKAKERISFKTTERFVGDEEQMHNMPQAVMVYGGMIVKMPEPVFASFLRGMEGKGWSGLRRDEYRDLVGGMREIARRMGLTPEYLRQAKGEGEPDEDDVDLDDLLKGL